MAISPDIIERVRLASDIVEIVREYVPGLKRAGRNWKANCPFHNERTPSFMVSAEKGIFHCFGCHAGGDVFKFVSLIDNLSWPESVRKLAGRAGIVIKESADDSLKRSERQELYDILEQAAQFYHRFLKESAGADPARDYLKRRGVSGESIEHFRLGFAPRGQLITSASKKGVRIEQLAAAGLVTKPGAGRPFEYMSDRLVFPIYDSQGHVVAFGGRTLKNDQPKYLNTPETSVYSKSHHLYGLFQAIPTLRQARDIIILEGYMDVVVTHQYGITNSVATLGTAFTQQHSQLLNRYAEKITLLFDPDAAGNNAARRAVEALVETESILRVVNLPGTMDPDEFLIAEGAEKFRLYLEGEGKSAVDFLTEQSVKTYGTDTPDAKMKVVSELMPFVDRLKSAVLRSEWIRHIAYRLAVSEDALKDEWLARKKNPSARQPFPVKEEKTQVASVVRTAEEEILHIVASHPECLGMVKEDLFTQERTRRVYGLLAGGTPVSDVVNSLDEADTAWFTELALEEKNYSAPEQVLNGLLRETKNRELERMRRKLEKEVIQMLNGTLPPDEHKIELYKDLNRQLKGSVKLE